MDVDELASFVRESNWIEGIRRDPTRAEIDAHAAFLALREIDVDAICAFVGVVQPGAVLRDQFGLNVRVGNHYPPRGSPAMRRDLTAILRGSRDPYQVHVAYETLHPFTDGNGRSGRVLWLRMMGSAPLGFLHHWYYQSLDGSGYRGKADTIPAQALPT